MMHNDLDYAGRRVQLVGSRIVEPEQSGGRLRVFPMQHQHHHHHGHEDAEDPSLEKGPAHTPKFAKTHSASNFELFYDLWFVANLNVFTSIHHISDWHRLYSFIGYMILLWTTWLLTSIYDIRFAADSVWERCFKAVHLGVMIGFAEIGTNFDPNDQIASVFRTMSLFLAVSRLMLAFQYGMVLFQIRKYAHGKRPLFITAFMHLCTAAVYFGISFRYDTGKSSRVFLIWYLGGLVECIVHLSVSQVSYVLTFLGTHLGERLNLLTLVILGEGCIILAKSVTLLVKDTFLKDETNTMWSSTLIGLVTAGTALIYIIFQLYFDWMHGESSMSKQHQIWWAVLHLPFHIALVLLLEGASQFIIWARILESTSAAIAKVVAVQEKLSSQIDITSEELSDKLKEVVQAFLEKYQPAEVIETWKSIKDLLADISEIPDSFWKNPSADPDTLHHYENDLAEIMNTMVNAVYTAFGIEAPGEENGDVNKSEYWQSEAVIAIAKRFILVYIYAFACAGVVLLFLTVIHIISKRRGWTPFNIWRTAICIALSICLALLTAVASNTEAVLSKERQTMFVGSVMMLPTITIVYFLVLVLTHLPHPSSFCMGSFKRGAYSEVEANKDHSLRLMSNKNRHIADFENRRTGYETGYGGAGSPPPLPPRYERHESMHESRGRESSRHDHHSRDRTPRHH